MFSLTFYIKIPQNHVKVPYPIIPKVIIIFVCFSERINSYSAEMDKIREYIGLIKNPLVMQLK